MYMYNEMSKNSELLTKPKNCVAFCNHIVIQR